jgi:hypothetical protein
MFGRRLSSFSAPFVICLVLVAAAGATPRAVVVSPQTPGSTKAPAAQTVTLNETQIGYASGRPSRTLLSTTEQLPTSFKIDLAQFPACPTSLFASVGNDPPACPAGSQVGTTNFTAYVPSLNLTTTAAGYIYKTGADQVNAWVKITKPVDFAVALTGKLTPATTTVGPSIFWDLSAAINFGVTADITAFQTVWDTQAETVTTTTTTAAEATPKQTTKPAPKHKKKRKRKTTKKTKTTKTTKTTKKKKTKTKTTTKTVSASVFESTGCPSSGSWNYSAVMKYKAGADETLTSSLNCSPQAPTTVTVTVTTPSTCVLNLICAPTSSPTALSGDAGPAAAAAAAATRR